MHQSPDDFSEYYNSPTEYHEHTQDAQAMHYAHPEYYQQQNLTAPANQPQEQIPSEQPPSQNPGSASQAGTPTGTESLC